MAKKKTITLIDVFMSRIKGELITIDRSEQVAKYMLQNKRYDGNIGRYAPIEEKEKWFEFEVEKKPAKKKPDQKADGPHNNPDVIPEPGEEKPAKKKTTRKRKPRKKKSE